jgi:long-chain fatty acid transport protein
MKKGWWIAAACLVAAPAHWDRADAAGYGIYEEGAAVLGMAGAGTASVHDASAVFYNPAALTHIVSKDGPKGLFYVGGSILTPFSSFAGVNPYPGYGVTEEMEHNLFPIPAVYYARRVNERWVAGLGVSSDYGLGVEWKNPDTFTGRYIVTRANLDAVNIGLSAAIELTPEVSAALGADLLFSKVRLENRILAPIPGGGGAQADVAESKLDANWKSGPGWNAAVTLAPSGSPWKFGATYRSKIVTKPSGDATFKQIPTGDPAFDAGVAATLPPNQGVSTVLRFPAIWAVGGAWMPHPWTVEMSLVYTEWKAFTDLPIRFDQTPQNDRTIVENYDNTLAVRLGAEHRLPSFTYRFGYYYEQKAAPAESVSPILPDAARHGVTLGVGFTPWSNVTVDLYNLALFTERRSTEGVNRDGYNGEYHTYVNAAGLNVGFRW